LVGVHGPEMAALKKGDKIYPADETKKILNGHSPQKLYNGYAKGTGGKPFNRYATTHGLTFQTNPTVQKPKTTKPKTTTTKPKEEET
jgi:hypothetical protein